MIRNLMRGTALASALALPLFPSAATAQIAVSANDNKIALVDGQNTVPANPPPDTVSILDIGVSPPKVLGELQAPSSVVGVPQSVAVSKDEWERRKYDWLPAPADSEYLLSIMAKPIYEPGKFANYIAPPRRGINQQPIDFEYVRTEL
jgi:hypothetical protein